MGSHLVRLLQFAILFSATPLSGQEILPQITITINSRNGTINQVLDEISLQTGYNFTYNAALVPGENQIDFQVSDMLLKKALDSLLREPRLAYRIIDRNIVIYRANEKPPSPVVEKINRPLMKGRVVDSRSGKPLEYATIAMYGTSLGSVSNEEGEFSFKIPPELPDPLIVVSYMGYKNRFLPVSYPVEQEVVVELEKETIPLQEVIIRLADPVILVEDALERIPSNYLKEHSTMTAYYRESVMRDKQCVVFTEAVLDVAKTPYASYSLSDQVRIRQGRKITDISSEDTVIIKLHSGIYSSFNLDVVRNRPDFLSEDFLNLYDLEFTDMMTYGDRLVYVISFRQKNHITSLMFQGKIYLDQESLAILAADFEYNPELIHKEPDLFLVSHSPRIRIRPISAKYHVDYRPINDRYHVSQVRAEVEMKVRRRRQWISSRYTIGIEMAITDVVPGERLRIPLSDRVKPNSIISDRSFGFDPVFWGIYNTIQPEATLMESVRKIEHNLQDLSEERSP